MMSKCSKALALGPGASTTGLSARIRTIDREVWVLRWLSVWTVLVGGYVKYRRAYHIRLIRLHRELRDCWQAWTYLFWKEGGNRRLIPEQGYGVRMSLGASLQTAWE